MPRLKQTLLLNEDGMLISSSDILFDTAELLDQNILTFFPFLESVFLSLISRLEEDKIVLFPGVETKHEFLPGYYDYQFNFHYKENRRLILWQILDATKKYNQIKITQQSYNEDQAFPKDK